MSNTFDKAWNNILENFDWAKVHKVMEALEWKYYDTSPDTSPELTCPTIGTLVKTGQCVCQSAWKQYETYKGKEHWYCGTGGFEAEVWVDERDEAHLRLQFIVTGWESYIE